MSSTMSSAIVPANTSFVAIDTFSDKEEAPFPLSNAAKGKEFEIKVSKLLKAAEIKSWRLQ